MSSNLPSPSTASFRSMRPVPLLSLAPPALALGEDLAVGEPGEDNNVGEIWNVITRAADLVKDGERLENLAWRHWGQPRRSSHAHAITHPSRRLSMSSNGTASTSSLHTLHTPNDPIPFLHRSRSFEKRTFGGALKLLLEKDENNFKDWVEDAKKSLPPTISPPGLPTISVPDTPVANVEIRLVEPTPVPSRVGSLGGSMGASGPLGAVTAVPPALHEDEDEYEEELEFEHTQEHRGRTVPVETNLFTGRARSPKKKGKFFVQSSPTKGSGSDTSQRSHPSPVVPMRENGLPNLTKSKKHAHARRGSSDESSAGQPTKSKADLPQPPTQKRHVSLSTMRGKYHAEKRRIVEEQEQQKQLAKDNEESGWEDEDENEIEEDWSDEDESAAKRNSKGKGNAASPETQDKRLQQQDRRSSNSSKSQPARSKSHTQLDLAALLTRKTSRHDAHDSTPPQNNAPPPPAPTPLRRMSKKERAHAAAERAKIEAQLEAQRKREMFAKQQIFGDKRPAANTGLLANALRSGASMVNLQSAGQPAIRPSPTHGQLSSLAFSPAPAPALLRSKSAVAMPVQTGVSVTIPPHALHEAAASKKGQSSSQERAKAQVEMESETEESDGDADYLNTTKTRQKLAEMAARREAKTSQQAGPSQPAQPQVLPSGQRVDEYGVVQPMTPTTRRRHIIVAEMSVSLRKNVILEREKSAGLGTRPNPAIAQGRSTSHGSVAGQQISSHSSADNLVRYGGGQALERHNSQPNQPTRLGNGGYMPPIYSQGNSPVSPTTHVGGTPSPVAGPASTPAPAPEVPRRRPHSTLLGGANFLRPLTRASTDQTVMTRPGPSSTSSMSNLNRAKSSVALSEHGSESVSPHPGGSVGTGVTGAPAMVRRATDHEGLQMLQTDKERRRELVKRRETTDTSYRFHGW